MCSKDVNKTDDSDGNSMDGSDEESPIDSE